MSRTGKKMRQRIMKHGSGVSCRWKCHERIPHFRREEIFHGYWNLADINRQRDYISQHTERSVKKVSKTGPSRRHYSISYFFTIVQVEIRVCKTFFLHTLDISDKSVHNIQSLHQHGKHTDQRGRHSHRKVDETMLDGVHEHIKSFKTVPSHYCRQTTSRKSLPGELNVKQMYRIYTKFCAANRFAAVKESMYRHVLNTSYRSKQGKKTSAITV